MAILFTAGSSAELSGGTTYAVTDQATHSVPDGVSTNFNNGPGSTFDGYDPNFSNEAIGIYHAGSGDNLAFVIQTDAPTGDYWFHARIQPPFTASSQSDGHFYDFYDANDNLIARLDMENGSVFPRVYGDTNESGTAHQLAAYITVTLDIKISTAGGNLTMEYYVNGGLVSSATAANTGGRGPVTRMVATHTDLVSSINQVTSWFFYSEIIVTDGESTIGWRLATLEVDTQGDNNDMTGSPLDLNGNDGLTISTDTVGHRESWNLTAYNGPTSPTSVRALVTKTLSRKGLTGPQSVRHHLRIGGVDYDAASTISPGDNIPEITVWDTNPATASAWATGDFAGVQQGVEAES